MTPRVPSCCGPLVAMTAPTSSSTARCSIPWLCDQSSLSLLIGLELCVGSFVPSRVLQCAVAPVPGCVPASGRLLCWWGCWPSCFCSGKPLTWGPVVSRFQVAGWSPGVVGKPLVENIASFLIMRGPFAYMGFAWQGCTNTSGSPVRRTHTPCVSVLLHTEVGGSF